ncbi:SHOCT domain-containing protein [Actinoplanes sp. NPDC023714]|uniref:SHOCT domain-containing protein n=1 Tax=Actinoplanes sp. NPDC023714 TaxID=3154322 RepID=UPI0033F86E38
MELSDEARARAERARAKAVKAGIDVRGALGVGHMLDGGASVYLLVFADRLELISTGQMGLRTGAGRSVIPLASITGVATRKRLLRGALLIEIGGTTVEFTTDRAVVPLLRELIEARLTAGPVANPLLKSLDELHAAGLLTDEEYAAKRDGLI